MSLSAREQFLKHAGVQVPVICGAMYPCSNPELIAAVSEAGGLGIVQPISLVYVYRYDFREGLRAIRKLTAKPYGFNVLTEQSSKTYLERMSKWVDIALEEGCRFFVTALGNPKWIVDRVKPLGGIVYHDVTERKWALKALDAGVDGFICVNNRAGGHAGTKTPVDLYNELSDLKVPLVCAGGIGNEQGFVEALRTGYAGVQMGTRFIATQECGAHDDYKQAIVRVGAEDIVLTERLTGVPVSIIRTPSVDKMGTKAGFFARWLLKHPKLKHYARLYFTLTSFRTLKSASLRGVSYKDFWQAGKSVDGIESIESAGAIVARFAAALKKSFS
ncbi:MAG: nitronate monooxygenase [Bdellovibrionales bacterium]|nr:nitronate monooxygenase [Bdellovibrionales bacterium]